MMGFDMNDSYGAPGYEFILGAQSTGKDWFGNFYGDPTEYMLTRANKNNWLIGSNDTMLVINPFTMRNNTNLTVRISLEPFRDLRIDLNATQTHSRSRAWYGNNSSSDPTEQGSFSTSTISIGTAFENAVSENYYQSPSYTRFKEVRREIAQSKGQEKLQESREKGYNYDYVLDGAGFPAGFSGLSQDVMIPAFSAGYLGKSVKSSMIDYTTFLSQLPLPNWQVTYSGLSNFKALKQVLKSATLTHSYKSVYTIGNFATNTYYLEDDDSHLESNDFGDFYTRYSVSNVSLTENIVLGGIDITWLMGLQTRFELKKNRRIELSMSNNQIIENNAWEGTIGGGYTMNLPQIFSFEKVNERANFTLRADFTLRDDKTVIRKLAEETTQITDGRRNMAIKFTADYLLLKDLTFRLYFDWMRNNPYVSAVNTANWAAGFSLRYVLGM
jgi:cell surface protein SprA